MQPVINCQLFISIVCLFKMKYTYFISNTGVPETHLKRKEEEIKGEQFIYLKEVTESDMREVSMCPIPSTLNSSLFKIVCQLFL